MPIISQSTYRRPSILFNEHLETIVPGLLRRVNTIPEYDRERIVTPDNDFLDLDWIKNNKKRLIIISHGLEGDSSRPYIRGMARAFYLAGWDILAWNYRGCSGEMNNLKIFYHSGASYDLETVVNHAAQCGYDEIVLTGFSLGGNMTLKYLGEQDTVMFDQLKAAVVFSVPLDLAGCSKEIDLPHNILYSKRFLKSLKQKAQMKNKLMPGSFDMSYIKGIQSIYDFDDNLTAPLHGFKGADHYYEVCSSRNYLASIKVKTLVVNAENDPFLSDSCLDKSLFKNLNEVFFENPKNGGHVGFSEYNQDKMFWSEKRALQFVNETMKDLSDD